MKEISIDELAKFQENFESDRSNLIAKRAVSTNGIYKSAQDMNAIDRNSNENFTFSTDDVKLSASNQNHSGRCWIYSGLNTLRNFMVKKYNLPEDFELSQNYENFYDKLEKSNYFYQNVIETADKPMSDRGVHYLFSAPQEDGGDWCLVCALIDKYGVVPKDQMNETNCSINSSELNTILNRKLRKDGLVLRRMVTDHASEEEISSTRKGMLDEVYRILAIALGVPPKEITFEYKDTTDEKKFHQYGPMTPTEFYKDFIGLDLNDYLVIMNVPDVEDMPYGKTYSVQYSGNMVGGRPNIYLNVPGDEMERLTIEQLKDGQDVWFGCDVMQQFDRQKGIMDLDMYGFNDLFDIDFDFKKGDMFTTRESLPTHAMVITGVNIKDEKPTRFKIENSWGDKIGDKGFMVMGEPWFQKYTYEVVINKKYLSDEQLKAFEEEPIMLPFWNSMQPTR